MTPTAAIKTPIDGATAAAASPATVIAARVVIEPPALEEVAERQQQDQACRVADLGGRHDEAGDRRRDAEQVADGLEQRLRQVVAGHRLAGRDGEQQHEAAAHAAAGDGLGGVLAERSHALPTGRDGGCQGRGPFHGTDTLSAWRKWHSIVAHSLGGVTHGR